AWNAGFIWDDDVYIIKNKLLTAPDGLRRIWFSQDSPSQYCPMVYTSFRIERELWGLNASGYHWINILLHAANVVLLWKILQRLKIPGAWLAAALFALHPVHVESVAWVTELKNTLSGLFFFCSILTYLNFDERRNRLAYISSLALFILGLLCKTAIAPLPARCCGSISFRQL